MNIVLIVAICCAAWLVILFGFYKLMKKVFGWEEDVFKRDEF